MAMDKAQAKIDLIAAIKAKMLADYDGATDEDAQQLADVMGVISDVIIDEIVANAETVTSGEKIK